MADSGPWGRFRVQAYRLLPIGLRRAAGPQRCRAPVEFDRHLTGIEFPVVADQRPLHLALCIFGPAVPRVAEFYLATGQCDAVMRVVTCWRFQSDHLARIPGLQSLKTDVPMETIKRSHELPLS